MTGSAPEEILPVDLDRPTSIFLVGTDRALLKWVAVALLARYADRVYWTDIRRADETLEPLDPLAMHAVPEDHIHVVTPREMERDEEQIRRVDAASAQVNRSDEPPESLRRITEFLRLPARTQARIVSTSTGEKPAILVASNAHLLMGIYPREAIAPMIHAILDSGVSLVLLWTATPPPLRSVFDVVLVVDGDIAHWKDATLRSEQGVTTGPLGTGPPVPLAELPAIAHLLERSLGGPGSR